MAKITIYVPDEEASAYSLEGAEQVTVGRGSDADITIDHPSISGSHARLVSDGSQWTLEDLGSTNGTFVEGEAVSQVALASGSQIMFGQVQADFEEETAAAEPEAAAATGGEGESYGYGGPMAELADSSVRPSGFKDLSPIEKVEKKDVLAQVAMIVGVLAIAAAIGLVVMSVLM